MASVISWLNFCSSINMKKKHFIIAAICGITLLGFRTADVQFPELVAQTLDDKTITLPKDVKGKFIFVGMASSQKAQTDLETWIDPVYKSFVGNETFQVQLYFVAMANSATAGTVKNQMKKQLDAELQKYILVYSGDISPFKTALDMKEKDKPYFFVIDPRGKVTYSTSGAYSEKKLDEIADKLSE